MPADNFATLPPTLNRDHVLSVQACYRARRPALRVTNHLGHSSTEDDAMRALFAVVVTVASMLAFAGSASAEPAG